MKMPWPAFLGLGVLGVGLQMLIAALFGADAAAWMPDPLVWLVLVPILWGPAPDAAGAAWAVGLMRDLVLPDPLGLHSLMLGLAAIPAWQLRHGFDARRPSARVITAVAVTTIYALGCAGMRCYLGEAGLAEAARAALLPVLSTAALASPAVNVLLKVPSLGALERRGKFLGAV
jgi:rod shape-determining protein MreD